MRYFFTLILFLVIIIPSQAQLIQQLNKKVHQNPKDPQAYISRAQYYYSNRHYRNAIRDLDKALELKANLTNAYLLRGQCKYEVDDISGAINDYNRSLYYDPNLAKAFYLRGVIRQEDDPKGACEDFVKAKKLGHTQSIPIQCP